MSVDKKKLVEWILNRRSFTNKLMREYYILEEVRDAIVSGKFDYVCPDCGGTEINVMCDDPYYAEPCICTVDLMADNLKLCDERNKLKNTVEFWETECINQVKLKLKAEKERDEALQEISAYKAWQPNAWDNAQELDRLKKAIAALQEERDHLLAANDEYQEKLRFEEEEEDPPICFKMDANGNLTRV